MFETSNCLVLGYSMRYVRGYVGSISWLDIAEIIYRCSFSIYHVRRNLIKVNETDELTASFVTRRAAVGFPRIPSTASHLMFQYTHWWSRLWNERRIPVLLNQLPWMALSSCDTTVCISFRNITIKTEELKLTAEQIQVLIQCLPGIRNQCVDNCNRRSLYLWWNAYTVWILWARHWEYFSLCIIVMACDLNWGCLYIM